MKPIAQIDTRQIDLVDHSHLPSSLLKSHYRRINQQIKDLGADSFDLALPETHVLPLVIHPIETIKGVVYGKYTHDNMGHQVKGRGMLVATDKRILLIDRKPLFIKCNEISYKVINAINYTHVSFAGTITLHTRLGDISIRTFNKKCAHRFVEAIEAGTFAGVGEFI